MNVKKKLLATGCATLLGLGIAAGGALSASAVEVSSYCLDHLTDRTQDAPKLPSRALNCQVQAGPARAYGYTGPINGTLSSKTWKAVQSYLRTNWDYKGSLSGAPGPLTYKAIQRAANATGFFTTPVSVDGTLELKDWQGWAYRVKSNYFSE